MAEKGVTEVLESGDRVCWQLAKPELSRPLECHREGPTHDFIRECMEDHEGSVGLQVVDWVCCTIKRVDGGHFELGG